MSLDSATAKRNSKTSNSFLPDAASRRLDTTPGQLANAAAKMLRAMALVHDVDQPEPVSSATLKLAEADLERSGLSLAAVRGDGVYAVDDASAVNPDFADKPALILQYFDAQGRPATYDRDGRATPFCRARYLVPPGFKLPRGRKYDQPHNSGTPPYFSRCFDWRSVGPGKTDKIVIVEGEKKATALGRAGIPTVAVGGVFNFSDGSSALHPALAKIVERCQDLYILFDSDIAEKPLVQLAEQRLAGQIALLGARVHPVRIPPDGDGKLGADDYILEHGVEALQQLILNTPALGDTGEHDADTVSVAELLGREVTPVEELIPGWVEKGIPTFLAGPGGVHKSRLALQWGLCLNTGATIWGIGAGLVGLRDPQSRSSTAPPRTTRTRWRGAHRRSPKRSSSASPLAASSSRARPRTRHSW